MQGGRLRQITPRHPLQNLNFGSDGEASLRLGIILAKNGIPYTKSRGDDQKTPNTALPKRVKAALGPYTPPQPDAVDEEIAATNKALQDQQKQEAAQLKALDQAQTKAAEVQRLRREMDDIRGRTKKAEDSIQQLEDTQGPLDKEAIQKLKKEKKELAADHQTKRKQLDALTKAANEVQKLQQDITDTRLSKAETERLLGHLKAQKDALQPLEELKQKAAELNEHITEDRRIVEDENTSPSERAAAEGRVATNTAKLEKVNAEIGSGQAKALTREGERDLQEVRLDPSSRGFGCWRGS